MTKQKLICQQTDRKYNNLHCVHFFSTFETNLRYIFSRGAFSKFRKNTYDFSGRKATIPTYHKNRSNFPWRAFPKFCKNRYDFPGDHSPQEQIFCKIASSDAFVASCSLHILLLSKLLNSL